MLSIFSIDFVFCFFFDFSGVRFGNNVAIWQCNVLDWLPRCVRDRRRSHRRRAPAVGSTESWPGRTSWANWPLGWPLYWRSFAAPNTMKLALFIESGSSGWVDRDNSVLIDRPKKKKEGRVS